MKRISLAVLIPVLAATTLDAAPCAAQRPPAVQSLVDVFENCIEQGILAQLRQDAASRSADAVRAACAAHRAALDPVLGAGARAAVDDAAARRVTQALAGVAAPGAAR
jgi:hypothetical protein